MSETEKLMRIKKKIDSAKSEQSEIRGQTTSIESQIKSKFKIETPEIENKLDEMAKELDEKELQLQSGMEKLNEAYNW
jgi:septal ring factor EnvC (AmiA/AmiB activator)